MMSDNVYTIEDYRERAIALDCTKNIHCESPAGAGKTTLLVDRYLKLLSRVGHPHELLALTFTNKAAGEMRQKIWAALKEIEEGKRALCEREIIAKEALRQHKNRMHLLFSSEGLRIMTFHSLCHTIVKSSPLDADVPTAFSIVEGTEYEELLKRVTDETLQKIASLKDGDVKKCALERRLLRANNKWSGLREDCITLIKRRDYLKDLVALISVHENMKSFKEKADSALESLIEGFMEKTHNALLSTELGRNWDVFPQCLINAQNLPPDAKWSELPQWQQLAEVLTTAKGTPRKRFTKEHGIHSSPDKNRIAQMISMLPEEVCQMLHNLKTLPVDGYDEDQIQSVYDLITILGEVISAWQNLCRHQGIIDFVGLELACLKVLNNLSMPDMQLMLGTRIKHILVDEFQDTSRNQWELLQRLCAGWSAGEGRTLFLVGDPKQSIYAFRKAEVSLFLEAKKGLPVQRLPISAHFVPGHSVPERPGSDHFVPGHPPSNHPIPDNPNSEHPISGHHIPGHPVPGNGRIPMESITLKSNFRSVPGLVEWTNNIFGETVMAHPRPDIDEVPFSPAAASIRGDHLLSLALFIQTDNVPDPQSAEADWLSSSVRKLAQNTRQDERIGILLFTRTRITQYLKALNHISLPVKVTEGLLLTDSWEVMSMHQMANALVRPHDDLAWISLLRSPWCWCSPDVLCRVWQQQPILWADKIASYMKSADHEEEGIKKWWEIIKKAKMRLGHNPLSKILKDAWLEIEGAYKLASLLGAKAVENTLRYLEILEESEQFIPEETLEKAKQVISKAYMPNAPEAYKSRIELMTVHKAKGLEFDYVFCPYLDWDPIGGGRTEHAPYLLEGAGEGKAVLALRKDQRQEEDDLVYKFLLKRENLRKYAEAKRLFYVAVTRAKKGLYLSGIAGIKNKRIYARTKNSPLSYIILHEGMEEWEIDPADMKEYQKIGTKGITIKINPPIPDKSAYPSSPLDLYASHPGSKSPLESFHNTQLPQFFPFSPEPIPYKIISPSEKTIEKDIDLLTRDIFREEAKNLSFNPNIKERAKGVIIHRIFASISKGRTIPSEKAVASALHREGINIKDAAKMAGMVLKEINSCMNEPTCAWINRTDHIEAYTELHIQDTPQKGIIRSGIIDRLILDNKKWWIIDYKTIQKEIEIPGSKKAITPAQKETPITERGLTEAKDLETFFNQQAEIYKYQMESYREMLSNWKGIPSDKIIVMLYFTYFQKAYYYP